MQNNYKWYMLLIILGFSYIFQNYVYSHKGEENKVDESLLCSEIDKDCIIDMTELNINESAYPESNDGYDHQRINHIDSVFISCKLVRCFDIIISGSRTAEAYDFYDKIDTRSRLSESFVKTTLEDLDVLFIQESDPVELSREESEYYNLMGPYYLTFEIFYDKSKIKKKIVFDSKYDVQYSKRFDNLYLRIDSIGKMLFKERYYTE